MKITEYEHPDHGWGYAIKDDGDNIIVQFLNAHSEKRSGELKKNTLSLAESEKQKLEKREQS